MYIIDLDGIFPTKSRDDQVTFQMLCDVLKPNVIYFPSKYSFSYYLYFFFDGERQAILYHYINPSGASFWMLRKKEFTVKDNRICFLRRRIRVKPMDIESARRFIGYLELF